MPLSLALVIFAGLTWKDKCLRWLNSSKGSSQDELLACAVPSFILWEIWLARNSMRHQTMNLNCNSVIVKVKNWLWEINAIILP